MIPRHVETLFCDDIRHEIGGKMSFIGVYAGNMYVPAFPVTLPKLSLVVKVVTPAEEPLQKLVLRVLKDDETLQEIELSEDQLASASELADSMTDEKRKEQLQMAQFILMFSPIQFDAPCSLRVRVETENGKMQAAGLKVDKLPSPANATTD